jgi:hypothetical protein
MQLGPGSPKLEANHSQVWQPNVFLKHEWFSEKQYFDQDKNALLLSQNHHLGKIIFVEPKEH